jgi:hypothetical protein
MAASSNKPQDYLSTQNSIANGTSSLPSASSNEACGKAFTDATDPKNINVKNELGVVQVVTRNDAGDVLMKTLKPDGSSYTMSEDGSVIFTTAKRENDHNTGRFDVNSQGSIRIKTGEGLFIEINNLNNVTTGKDGDSKTAKALSIVVYGNVDITANDGELNARAKNINLTAENEFKIKAGSKIQLLSGEGTGGNKSTTTESGATQSAAKEYGGVVEIKSGDLVTDVQTRREISSVNYTLTSHEGANIATEKLSNYGFEFPGSFTIDVKGDMYEKIGGKKRTDISGISDPITTLLPGQSSGYLCSVGALQSTGSGANTVTPNAFQLTAVNGGFKFYSQKGDIDLYTLDGYWGIGNSSKGIVGVDKPIPGFSNVKPGLYVKALKDKIEINSSAQQVDIFVTSLQKSGISLTIPKIDIKNPTGIYLN